MSNSINPSRLLALCCAKISTSTNQISWRNEENLPQDLKDKLGEFEVCKNSPFPLIAAAKLGSLELVRYFYNKTPAAINSINENGKTALLYAAEHGNFDMTKFLVGNGADIILVPTSFH